MSAWSDTFVEKRDSAENGCGWGAGGGCAPAGDATLLDETGTELPAETVAGGGIGVANSGVGNDDGDDTAIEEEEELLLLPEAASDTGGCGGCAGPDAPVDADDPDVGIVVPLATAAAAEGEGGVGRA